MSDQVMKYKGQIGSVEFDFDDDCLHGKLLYINDLVTYEAKSIPELRMEFHAAVDDYLETCEELGVEPNKPFKGSFNVRIGEDLHRKIAFKAAEQGISVNDAVTKAVSNYISQNRRSSDELLGMMTKQHFKQYVLHSNVRALASIHDLECPEPEPETFWGNQFEGSKKATFVISPERRCEH